MTLLKDDLLSEFNPMLFLDTSPNIISKNSKKSLILILAIKI